MSFPTGPVSVPPATSHVVDHVAAGRPVSPVWVNELGGVTFAIDGGAEYVKVQPAGATSIPGEPDVLAAEVERLRWAAAFTTVPRVLASGPGWLHTAGLPGRSAVDPRWADAPEVAARAIGVGLRRLHDALPVADCPFGRPSWIPADAPAADRTVVCHGDACAPNTLLADDGAFAGHVDLGDLGVADRWADLAIATLSLDWKFDGGDDGHDFAGVLLTAYGVAADDARIAWYRWAWDAFDDGLGPQAG